jgi:hypothetical protein
MLQGAQKYLGQSNIGTNQYDTGECVGLYNKVVQDVTGILYPIQGAQGAKDLLTAKNTRPDLFQQIKDKPGDPTWIPQPGDWVVWGSTWGGGWGHVACVKTSNANSFTSIEQNFVYHKVTEQWHDYAGVIGWIRYTPPAPVDPCADVKSQLAAAQTTINQQKSQLDTLTKENADLKKQLDTANATIADLQKKLETCGNTDITINFNIFGQILWALIQLFGNNKKG